MVKVSLCLGKGKNVIMVEKNHIACVKEMGCKLQPQSQALCAPIYPKL